MSPTVHKPTKYRKMFPVGPRPPQVSAQRPVPCFSHPASSHDIQQVFSPPCRGPTHTGLPVLAAATSELPDPITRLSCEHARTHTQFGNSGYVSHLGSFADLLNSDSITQRDYEHSLLYCPLSDLSFLIRPHVNDHVSEL